MKKGGPLEVSVPLIRHMLRLSVLWSWTPDNAYGSFRKQQTQDGNKYITGVTKDFKSGANRNTAACKKLISSSPSCLMDAIKQFFCASRAFDVNHKKFSKHGRRLTSSSEAQDKSSRQQEEEEERGHNMALDCICLINHQVQIQP